MQPEGGEKKTFHMDISCAVTMDALHMIKQIGLGFKQTPLLIK